MYSALFFEKLSGNNIRCNLCPHECLLKPGQTGICRVRSNSNGVLISENYGIVSAYHLDPVEKKPLYHYLPGTKVLSIGSVGCNLQCNFCQNCDISQRGVDNFPVEKQFTSAELALIAKESYNNIGIAYTYNEPVVFYEFMLDTAKIVSEMGLKNIMVSNGFINSGPLEHLFSYIDAFNIDLKAFTNDFYKNYTHSHIEPVKNTLKSIRKSGKHLEITNLIIPGLNDNESSFGDMVDWISNELGEDTILHLSRYFPRYKSKIPPTNPFLLLQLREIALQKLKFVYIGNSDMSENLNDTFCPKCFNKLIKRFGYEVSVIGADSNGKCQKCGEQVFVK